MPWFTVLDGRAFWLKIALTLALVSGFLLSYKLWLSSRLFPLAPVSHIFTTISSPLDYVWFVILLALLGAIVIVRRPSWLIWTFVLLAAFLSLWDQNRWQPWFYQYLFMMAALGFYPWGKTDIARQGAVLNTCRLLVASIYFWSGFQKMNLIFVAETFPWMIEPFVGNWAPELKHWANATGFAVPLLEAAMGISLLVPRLRKMAIGLALAMHSFILLCLGPLGQNWNTVVWPWNIAMALFVIILFVGTENKSLRAMFFTSRFVFHKIVLVLFAIMPLLSFFDLWDSYLSASLYSGNIKRAYVFIEQNVKEKLPIAAQKYAEKTGSRTAYRLKIIDWATEELGVPPYPEERVFRQIAKDFCGYANHASDVKLIIQSKPDWRTGNSATLTYDCLTI